MVDDKQIKQWLADGTITPAQARKMLSDSTKKDSDDKSNGFVAIVAIIGSILIFIGLAWLVAKNWHQIPDMLKVLILLGATAAAFVSGVLSRQKNHEGVGRALIALGALLFILSMFLISQIYNIANSVQHYAWILFFAWVVILITAYLLDSKENVVISLLTFFPWVITQYVASVSNSSSSSSGGYILSLILIFASAGILLFGVTTLHNALKHKFTDTYRFWTVFYFLVVSYLLSFQLILPMLSEYSFSSATFTPFVIIFILLCLVCAIIGIVYALKQNSISIKEILVFIGIVAVLLILVFSTKIGSGLVGSCTPKGCYDFKNANDCSTAPEPLVCNWQAGMVVNNGYCAEMSCYSYSNKTACETASSKLNCEWQDTYCTTEKWNNNAYDTCAQFNNQKNSCTQNSLCNWSSSSYGLFGGSNALPPSLWFLWLLTNIAFIGFIILMLWYGHSIGSVSIVNITIFAFILDVVSRYIGFWMDLSGYFAFSVLAIFGGLLLILGAWQIPKLRRKFIDHPNDDEASAQEKIASKVKGSKK